MDGRLTIGAGLDCSLIQLHGLETKIWSSTKLCRFRTTRSYDGEMKNGSGPRNFAFFRTERVQITDRKQFKREMIFDIFRVNLMFTKMSSTISTYLQ